MLPHGLPDHQGAGSTATSEAVSKSQATDGEGKHNFNSETPMGSHFQQPPTVPPAVPPKVAPAAHPGMAHPGMVPPPSSTSNLQVNNTTSNSLPVSPNVGETPEAETPRDDGASFKHDSSFVDEEEEKHTFVFEDMEASTVPPNTLKEILAQHELKKLSFKGNKLFSLPAQLNTLSSSLYYLNLSENKFTNVPPVVFSLKGLEILDLSFNLLSTLPGELSHLNQLIGLSLVGNNFEILPPVLADLPKLEFLELDNNPLRVPADIPNLDTYPDPEKWLTALKHLIQTNHTVIDNAFRQQQQQPFRSRSASESSIGLRNPKRMGFVMSRNATDQSYVANLHARGLSHDAHMLDSIALDEKTKPEESPAPLLSPNAEPTTLTSISVDKSKRLDTLAEERDLDDSLTDIDSSPMHARLHSAFRDTSPPSEFIKMPINSGSISPTNEQNVFDSILLSINDLILNLKLIKRAFPLPLQTILAEIEEFVFNKRILECLNHLHTFLEKLTSPTMFLSVHQQLTKRQQRQLTSAIVQTYPELESAFQQSLGVVQPLNISSSQPQAQDDQLHQQLHLATKQAQSVLSLLNQVVAKSAASVAVDSNALSNNTNMASRVRDLSAVCLRCNNSIRGVRQLLEQQVAYVNTRTRQLSERRRFFDEVNGFLKAVLATLASVKNALNDIPLLSDNKVSGEVAELTRLVKEIPLLLEQSSYWLLLENEEIYAYQTSTPLPSVNTPGAITPGTQLQLNMFSSQSQINLPPPTPLTASLGAAAQALVSPSERLETRQEGYVQYGLRIEDSINRTR